ncbi:glycosyltransferase [Paenarthrobacter aurescens]|uniref:glycosyltransferase n=1 Tax=Paenarthrobacter aurescens TaxID=43663 RepID=UPI0021C196AA|nr:glycosyltransferase [Paenarthrobacter aurescens]MCT9868914.1 glycosyltransferase [Paenarthrobacter aurescens]
MDLLHPHSIHTSSRGSFQARRGTDSLRRSQVDLEVVIPAYNEAARIPGTLIQTLDFLAGQPWSSRIVVVDNGSVDETGAVVRRISRDKGSDVPISVVGCSRRGKGAAVSRGLLSGTSRYTGFFDADLATPLETLIPTMAHLEEGAAAVIASRHAPGSTFVQPQQLGRRVGGTAFRVLTKSKVKGIFDTQCGFKFFERGALTAAMVQCRTTGFAFDVELLLRLQHQGARIIELPVAWTDVAASTFRPFKDGISSFASVLQLQKAMP